MHKITTSIQVLDRAASILDVLAGQDQSASLKLVAAETELHPSTAFRILASLVGHGLVDRDPAGNYRLGPRLLRWGDRVRSRLDLRSEARPVMERLRDQVGETVNLAQFEGDEVVYIERITAKRAVRVEQVIGSRAPLHVTAVGKLMLGNQGDAAVRDYAQRTGLPRYTINTVTDVDALVAESLQAASDGYAYDIEEAELGVGCIGVVIRDSTDAVVAGLSISAPIDRWRQEWVDLVRKSGLDISTTLGYAK